MGKNTTWHHYATVIYGYTFIKSSMDSDWSLAIIFWGFTIPTTQSVRNILRYRYNIHVGYTDLPAGLKWDTYICISCIIEIIYRVVEIIVKNWCELWREYYEPLYSTIKSIHDTPLPVFKLTTPVQELAITRTLFSGSSVFETPLSSMV